MRAPLRLDYATVQSNNAEQDIVQLYLLWGEAKLQVERQEKVKKKSKSL